MDSDKHIFFFRIFTNISSKDFPEKYPVISSTSLIIFSDHLKI